MRLNGRIYSLKIKFASFGDNVSVNAEDDNVTGCLDVVAILDPVGEVAAAFNPGRVENVVMVFVDIALSTGTA